MVYISESIDHLIIRRHIFLFFFSIIKFISILLLSLIICYIAAEVVKEPGLLKTEMYLLGLILLNYWFLRLILWIIKYYNNIIIICPGQVIIIKASLLLRDKIESLDASKIMKLDSSSNWILSNMFWYWNLIIEQQNDELRTFHFVSHPHRVVRHIQKQKNKDVQIKWWYETVDYPLV